MTWLSGLAQLTLTEVFPVSVVVTPVGAEGLVADAAAGLELSVVCQKAKATPAKVPSDRGHEHADEQAGRGLGPQGSVVGGVLAHPLSTVIVTGMEKVAAW